MNYGDSAPMNDYQGILAETPAPDVERIRLNRPKALNALRRQLMDECVSVWGRISGCGRLEISFQGGADSSRLKPLLTRIG